IRSKRPMASLLKVRLNGPAKPEFGLWAEHVKRRSLDPRLSLAVRSRSTCRRDEPRKARPVPTQRAVRGAGLTAAVANASILIDIERAATDRAHVVVVRRIAPALRVVELRPVVRLAGLVGSVDAGAQRLVRHAGGQRRPRVAGSAELLHV